MSRGSAHTQGDGAPSSRLGPNLLTPEEEVALRQIGSQSINVAPQLARRLVQLALAVPFRDGWRLTPQGVRLCKRLPKPPLLKRAPPLIDRILCRAIPLAQAAGIPQPGPASEDGEEVASSSLPELPHGPTRQRIPQKGNPVEGDLLRVSRELAEARSKLMGEFWSMWDLLLEGQHTLMQHLESSSTALHRSSRLLGKRVYQPWPKPSERKEWRVQYKSVRLKRRNKNAR
jgi:hypothetical protein